MTDIHVAIVAAGRQLAQARVLTREIAALRPDWPISVLVLPSEYPLASQATDRFETLDLEDFGDAAFVRTVSATPYGAQPAVAAPVLIESLLDRGAKAVLFVSPETRLLSEPVELEELLATTDGVVLPRLQGTLPDDGERPDLRDLAEAGDLDDGFFVVRGTEAGRRIARWWGERLTEQAQPTESALRTRPVGPHAQLDAIQACGQVGVLRDPGYGVSVWNLHERELGRDDDGVLTAAGSQVRVLRLPGFHVDRPYWLADFGTRNVSLGDPILEPLCEEYAEEIHRQGWPRESEDGDDGRLDNLWLGNGLRYDPRVRRMRQAAEVIGEDFGDLSTSAGSEALVRWLLEPARFGAANGINRYAYDAWLARPDVAAAYPDLDDLEVANGFIG